MPLFKNNEETQKLQTVLLFGKAGQGTTEEVIRRVSEVTDNPSDVIVVGPPSIYAYAAAGYDMFVPDDADDYEKNFAAPLRKGELKYSVVIHDKLNYHLALLIESVGGDSALRQQDWGVISNEMFSDVATAARGKKAFFATVELAPDDEGNYSFALNRFTLVKILPIFSYKVYCYAVPVMGGVGNEIVGIDYRVEENEAAALAFLQLPKVG